MKYLKLITKPTDACLYAIDLIRFEIAKYSFGVKRLAIQLLILSTVLIAAAGYVINDIFDQDTDLNKPHQVIIGTFLNLLLIIFMPL
jgi:4-hydroxybenzoate polyprenyltransferase